MADAVPAFRPAIPFRAAWLLFFIEATPGTYGDWQASLGTVITWSAVLIFGSSFLLYMALSRTLIRTYTIEYHTRPDYVLRVANRRILTDTQAGLFVTVFYGVLNPTTGTLTYCNAGHNPPYLLSARNEDTVQALRRTGMPLGIAKGVTWEQDVVQLAPGDMLVLYTDGVTEAQDGREAFFGKERLLEVVRTNLGRPAQDVQDALLAEVHGFVGDAPQFDDIALMVVTRSSTEEQLTFD